MAAANGAGAVPGSSKTVSSPRPSAADKDKSGYVRKKRGMYIPKACLECRRRKSKCSGQNPCGRCAKHDIACEFPSRSRRSAADDPKSSEGSQALRQKIAILEAQLRSQSGLSAVAGSTNVANLPTALHHRVELSNPNASPFTGVHMVDEEEEQQAQPRVAAVLPQDVTAVAADVGLPQASMGQPVTDISSDVGVAQTKTFVSPGRAPSPALSSPFSNQRFGSAAGGSAVHTAASAHYKFNLSLAQTHLQARGIPQPDEHPRTSVLPTREPSPSDTMRRDSQDCDPLWLIQRQEALRLCRVYEEEIGLTYPFLEISKITNHIAIVYDALDGARKAGFAYTPLREDAILPADDLKIVKMVLACALVIESSGSSSVARRIFHHVQESAGGLIWGGVTTLSITIYMLCAIWLFLADNDYLAWRIIGVAARWCLELGLNQSLYLRQMVGTDHDRKMVLRLFWCCQVLDRRWSFGSGLPFVIRDEDIEQSLPEPDDEVPYLQAMVSFGQIVSDVWHATYSTPIDATARRGQDEISYLEYRINKWWDGLPVTLQLGRGDQEWSKGTQHLRILLHLRKCQLLILLHQPVLHCQTRIRKQQALARSVVDTAKDVIHRLDEMNRTTTIYQTQQMCFNHFLVSALGVIFLAVSQAPGEFASDVKVEFNAALDLVQQLSLNSYVSKRLWRTIRGLRQLGDKLGVTANGGEHDGAGAEANRATRYDWNTGLGVSFDEELFLLENDLQFPFLSADDPVDGLRLTENMNAVFEAMQGDQNVPPQGLDTRPIGEAEPQISTAYADDSLHLPFSGQDVSRILAGMIGVN